MGNNSYQQQQLDSKTGTVQNNKAAVGKKTEEEIEEKFVEGFTSRSILGALFIGFVIVPGSIYLGLVAGGGLGGVADWVTVILFTEIMRRSFKVLRKQEIYILLYVCGGVMAGSGIFAGGIMNQYLIRSPYAEAFGIVKEIPRWVVPPPDSPALAQRTFFHKDWLPAITVTIIVLILSRFNWFGLGYILYRVTSDVERLPFPMAPIAAQGSTALADISSKKESWRWNVFSLGAFIGLVFGFFYVFIPTFTGLLFTKPIHIIPIPFVDLTQVTEKFLPAALTGLVLDLGAIMVGFIIPFPIVVGTFISSILVNIIVNPILYKLGILVTWRRGMGSIPTNVSNSIDLWMSIGIGSAFAIALIGFITVIRALIKTKQKQNNTAQQHQSQATPASAITTTAATSTDKKRFFFLPPPPEGRGDIPFWLATLLFVGSALGYIILCHKLVPRFPIGLLIFYGLIYTPLMSYISARLIGITGQGVGIPFVREGTFILSKYKGIDIWFAPLPLFDHGGVAQRFRELELTRTKITSLIKAELLIFPVTFISSMIFWSLLWKLGPIPSAMYPYAAKYWPQNAMFTCLWCTATREGKNWLLQAIKFKYVLPGFAITLLLYPIFALLKLPTMFFYGFIGGMGAWPHNTIPLFIGALLGRYVFRKRFGEENWKSYVPILLAGYSCGVGLIGMVGVGISLISKAVYQMPF